MTAGAADTISPLPSSSERHLAVGAHDPPGALVRDEHGAVLDRGVVGGVGAGAGQQQGERGDAHETSHAVDPRPDLEQRRSSHKEGR